MATRRGNPATGSDAPRDRERADLPSGTNGGFSPRTSQIPFLIRAVWYLFVGWWLAAIVIAAGYLAMATIVGIPLAFYLFNRIPQALTLRVRTMSFRTEVRDGVTYVSERNHPQHPWYVRAIYFVLIGWWLGFFWLYAAWLIGLLIITLPLSFWMYNRTSGVMTLQRH